MTEEPFRVHVHVSDDPRCFWLLDSGALTPHVELASEFTDMAKVSEAVIDVMHSRMCYVEAFVDRAKAEVPTSIKSLLRLD